METRERIEVAQGASQQLAGDAVVDVDQRVAAGSIAPALGGNDVRDAVAVDVSHRDSHPAPEPRIEGRDVEAQHAALGIEDFHFGAVAGVCARPPASRRD